jgi:hypothetical protein
MRQSLKGVYFYANSAINQECDKVCLDLECLLETLCFNMVT